jgi:hypothetical protein
MQMQFAATPVSRSVATGERSNQRPKRGCSSDEVMLKTITITLARMYERPWTAVRTGSNPDSELVDMSLMT